MEYFIFVPFLVVLIQCYCTSKIKHLYLQLVPWFIGAGHTCKNQIGSEGILCYCLHIKILMVCDTAPIILHCHYTGSTCTQKYLQFPIWPCNHGVNLKLLCGYSRVTAHLLCTQLLLPSSSVLQVITFWCVLLHFGRSAELM